MPSPVTGGAAAAVGLLILVLGLSGVDDPEPRFEARLDWGREAGAATGAGVDDPDSEVGTARFARDGHAIRYEVWVPGLRDILSVHIHAGSGARPGPARVRLFHPAEPADRFYGPLEGSFTSDAVTGATVESLIAEMGAGRAHLDVHTVSGEIVTGQIRVRSR